MTYSALPSHLQRQRCEQIVLDFNRDNLEIAVLDERAIKFQLLPVKTHKAVVRQDQPRFSGLDMGTIKAMATRSDNLCNGDIRHTPRRPQPMPHSFRAIVTEPCQLLANKLRQSHQKMATRKEMRAVKNTLDIKNISPLKCVFTGDVAGHIVARCDLHKIYVRFLNCATSSPFIPRQHSIWKDT